MKKSYAKSLKSYDEPYELEAEKQGIPYQVLIRVLILDGLDRMKKAA